MRFSYGTRCCDNMRVQMKVQYMYHAYERSFVYFHTDNRILAVNVWTWLHLQLLYLQTLGRSSSWITPWTSVFGTSNAYSYFCFVTWYVFVGVLTERVGSASVPTIQIVRKKLPRAPVGSTSSWDPSLVAALPPQLPQILRLQEEEGVNGCTVRFIKDCASLTTFYCHYCTKLMNILKIYWASHTRLI